MSVIDSTARVDTSATIGRDVSIGPYCVVGPHVTIGDECRLESHVNIAGHTTLGARCTISPFASLGTAPQSVHYKGESSRLVIGSDCTIREYVTMNIGTAAGKGVTSVGDHCSMMVGAHVGHDCTVGNHVTFANNATLGGFCEIGDYVFLGGLCAVHQFGRVGEQVMIGGLAAVTADVIPYAIAFGNHAHLAGINQVGLKRRGLTPDVIRAIHRGYRAIFFGPGTRDQRLDRVASEFSDNSQVMRMIEFIRAAKLRRVALPRRRGTSSLDAD